MMAEGLMTSKIGPLHQVVFHRNPWTLDWERGNHIGLWGKER